MASDFTHDFLLGSQFKMIQGDTLPPIRIQVLDNIQVQTVTVEYWFGTGSHTNSTMTLLSGIFSSSIIIPFGSIETLNYILRWVLPFNTPLREVVDMNDVGNTRCLDALRKQGLRSNLDLLEAGRTIAGRVQLSRTAGVPEACGTALVLRVDISRLAYVRGKTVNHLCGGGYNSLGKIANANLAEMEADMDAYYRALGKSLADFKVVVPLTWMIGGAKILPRVVMDC